MGKLELIKDDDDMLLGGELLTVSDLAAILKTKEKTIRQWVYQGRIPSLKINGLLRFASREIEAWLHGGSRRGGQL